VLRCPLTPAVNGQRHSSSCFVCNSQYPGYHGLVYKEARLRRGDVLGQPMHSNTTTTLRSTKCLGGSSEPCIQAQTTASHIPQANSRHLIGGARCECYQHVNRRYNNATCVHRLPVCTLYVRRRLLSVCLRRRGPQALCPPRPPAPPPPCPAGPDTGPSPLPWALQGRGSTFLGPRSLPQQINFDRSTMCSPKARIDRAR
jgi:hypothetical protein